MPIRKSDAEELIRGVFKDLHTEVARHRDFLDKIQRDDDWSFVIKSHALIEASFTQLLLDSVGDERYKRVFERLPLSGAEVGKLEVAKELGLCTSEQRRLVRSFSSLRNRLVHRVENVGFSLEAHIRSMDAGQKKAWQESIVWFCEGAKAKAAWQEASLTMPKMVLWLSIFVLVAHCSITSSTLRATKKTDELSIRTSEEMFKELISPKTKNSKKAPEPTR